ncbi:MAG: outer membrane beta-barrel protein [Hydrotalea flava]|uniref:outer membrane beta-barrel protein n=1 Tax=Hydrotalea sp. AMD TaxID=2501297 RepID=UPI0009436437|nr:outer membrane beta-barrel protein [Hydrotalea sp. AMD]MBY0347920.1 porin [Hydrotalea flava]NIM36643.1 outer membrane beta-barrel protein [Hydrotalea flava]NIM39503.1 outer membrane beta-barrel protein [Hydrotalea flava]NIN04692.1 outer membrane beta-barrel protein [Hydrotalea flava]NIN16364.1 outer membrane beta-barrel protein [Hydrotalea flava]
MLKKICQLTAISFAAVTSIEAQTDSTKKIESNTTFTYAIDAYYRTDFTDPSSDAKSNNFTSFTDSKNSFELGMASVRVDHSFGKVGATADLGFGKRAENYSYNDVGTMAAIKQLFLTYTPVKGVTLTAGKFGTFIGYEVLDAYANRNYSMSYGFSYGPFFHTGIKADIALGGKTAIMVGIANPTDFSTTTSGRKVAIAQLSTGTKDDKFKAILNFHGGTDFNQFDLVLNANLSSKFSLDYDGTIKTVKVAGNSNSWSSNVLYINYDATKTVGFTLREEYFDDKKNVAGVGAGIIATTLSGNIHINNLTLIPEVRIDNAQSAIFSKSSLNSYSKSDVSCLLAAVYKF